jgi:hypothetical protein
VDYSLLILEALMMMLERLEMQARFDSGGASPQISAGFWLCFVVSVFSPPPPRQCLEDLLYAVLGQDGDPKIKTNGCGHSRPKLDQVVRLHMLTVPPWLSWPSWLPSAAPKAQSLLLRYKNVAEKY